MALNDPQIKPMTIFENEFDRVFLIFTLNISTSVSSGHRCIQVTSMKRKKLIMPAEEDTEI